MACAFEKKRDGTWGILGFTEVTCRWLSNKDSISEPVVVNMWIMLSFINKFRLFAAEIGGKSLLCNTCCIAQLAQCFGGFFHLKASIFVILRKWVLNVICQEAKRLYYFLSRPEFYPNNSIYQEEESSMKNVSKLSCERFCYHLILKIKPPLPVGWYPKCFHIPKRDYDWFKYQHDRSFQRTSGQRVVRDRRNFRKEKTERTTGVFSKMLNFRHSKI